MGVHGLIEFGNRLLTFVLTAAVLAAAVAAWRAGRRDLLARAGLLVLGVVAQALLGAVTVVTGLNPVTVMAHFLLSMVLIAVAVDAHARTTAPPEPGGGPIRREVRTLALLLAAGVAVTLALGTVVTGTGPHSGDEDATDRLPFDLASVTQLHADAVFLVLGLAVGLLLTARAVGAGQVARRTAVLLAVLLAQGAVGFVQYATDLPVALVGAHVLGAALVWIATLRVEVVTRAAGPGAPAPRRPDGVRVSAAGADGSRRAPAGAAPR